MNTKTRLRQCSGKARMISALTAFFLLFSLMASSHAAALDDEQPAWKTGTAWHFETEGDLLGWTLRKNLSGTVEDSVLKLQITGEDPDMISSSNLNIDADKYTHIRIVMKKNASGNTAQLYFSTQSNPGIASGKMVQFQTVPFDEEFTAYVIKMNDNANWTGIVDQIRFDVATVTTTSGNVDIQSIELLGPSDDEEEGEVQDGPVLFITPTMLEEVRQRVLLQQEPFYSAWTIINGRANTNLSASFTPYQGEEYLKYYTTGRDQSFGVRDMALVYAVTGNAQYGDKAKQALLAWADDAVINDNPASLSAIDKGLVIARVMTVFCDAYALIYDRFSDEEIERMNSWFEKMAERIKESQAEWISNDYFDGQFFQNQLAAQTMGLLALGYSLNDESLVGYALHNPENPRNALALLEGLILMEGEEPWHKDRTHDGAPAPQTGEIFDRYRTVQGSGLHYTVLSTRFLSLIAEMAFNNDDSNLFTHVGANGERLELAYEFYADFFITGDSSSRGGYYAAETVDLADMNIYELGHRHYPHNEKIKDVLSSRYRVVNDIQTFGYSLVLTHGLDDVDDPPPPVGIGITEWSFSEPGDFKGWNIRKSLTGEVADGSLNLSVVGDDPGLMSPTNLAIKAEEFNYFRFVMKNNSAEHTNIQIFFITDKDAAFSNNKMVGAKVVAEDEKLREYAVDMSSNPLWKDYIMQIRFDVVDSGSVQIQSFQFSDNGVVEELESLELASLSVAGYDLTPQFNPKDTGPYQVSVPYAVTAIQVEAETVSNNTSLDIAGEEELQVGNNKITVAVADQYGNSLVYKLNVVRAAMPEVPSEPDPDNNPDPNPGQNPDPDPDSDSESDPDTDPVNNPGPNLGQNPDQELESDAGQEDDSETAGESESSMALTDIQDHPAYQAIRKAIQRNIVKGYPDNTFRPEREVTREEFIHMLVHALKLQGNGKSFTFSDADKIGVWAQPAVALAIESGLIQGYADGSFRPKEKLSRMEQAALLSRAYRLIASDEANLSYAVSNDAGDVPSWGITYVSFVTQLQVMEWRGNNLFEPRAAVTRAEAIVSLLALLEELRD